MARTREPDRAPAPIPGPVRTCVGCRSRESASELLRVVAVGGVLVPDPRRREPGRGAWLHHDTDCLRRAERRTAFPRALRAGGSLDGTALRALLETGPDRPGGHDDRRDPEIRKQVDPR